MKTDDLATLIEKRTAIVPDSVRFSSNKYFAEIPHGRMRLGANDKCPAALVGRLEKMIKEFAE